LSDYNANDNALANSTGTMPGDPSTTMSDSAASLPASTQGPAVAAAAPQPSAPSDASAPSGRPSLFRGILAGALAGMAAGTQAKTFGEGVTRGVAGGLQQQQRTFENEQTQQRTNAAVDQAHAEAAFTAANTAKILHDVHLMPADRQSALIDEAVDQGQTLVKAGAVVPVGPAGDRASAQNQYIGLLKQNPAQTYGIQMSRGEDGGVDFQVVQYPHAPLKQDVVLKGMGPNGEDVTVPAGTSADAVGKYYSATLAKKMDTHAKQILEDQKQGNRVELQNLKGQQAAAKGSAKQDTNLYEGTDGNGNQVAGTANELQASGVRNYAKMPALTQTQTLAARELTSPDGLFATARGQIMALSQAGKLGPVSSRWNNFWAKKGLDGDQQAFRGTLGLIATKLMQAHMGNRGGKDAMEHFAELVPENSTPAALMAALNNEYQYVSALAKRPKAVSNGQ
jgi:hypothetical protein